MNCEEAPALPILDKSWLFLPLTRDSQNPERKYLQCPATGHVYCTSTGSLYCRNILSLNQRKDSRSFSSNHIPYTVKKPVDIKNTVHTVKLNCASSAQSTDRKKSPDVKNTDPSVQDTRVSITKSNKTSNVNNSAPSTKSINTSITKDGDQPILGGIASITSMNQSKISSHANIISDPATKKHKNKKKKQSRIKKDKSVHTEENVYVNAKSNSKQQSKNIAKKQNKATVPPYFNPTTSFICNSSNIQYPTPISKTKSPTLPIQTQSKSQNYSGYNRFVNYRRNLFRYYCSDLQPMTKLTKPLEISIDHLLFPPSSPPLSVKCQTRPPFSVKSQTLPPLSVKSQTRPPLSVKSQTRPPLSVKSQTSPPLSVKSQTRPPLSVKSQTRPPLSVKSQTCPPLRVKSQTLPPISVKLQACLLSNSRNKCSPKAADKPSLHCSKGDHAMISLESSFRKKTAKRRTFGKMSYSFNNIWKVCKPFNRRPHHHSHRKRRSLLGQYENCIMASSVHEIIHSRFAKDTNEHMPVSQIKAMLSSGDRKLRTRKEWIQCMEEEAIHKFKELHNKQTVQVEEYDVLHHPEKSWLVSYGRWVINRKEEDSWPLLVKCLHKHPDSTLRQASKHRSFCLSWDGTSYTLRKDHAYYTEIQCHMAVTDTFYAEILVHTHKETAILPVVFDSDFWKQTEVTLETFFTDNILPYLKKLQSQSQLTKSVMTQKGNK